MRSWACSISFAMPARSTVVVASGARESHVAFMRICIVGGSTQTFGPTAAGLLECARAAEDHAVMSAMPAAVLATALTVSITERAVIIVWGAQHGAVSFSGVRNDNPRFAHHWDANINL